MVTVRTLRRCPAAVGHLLDEDHGWRGSPVDPNRGSLAKCGAQACNMRTGPGEESTLLDREDVSAAPGILDLAWLLTASVALGGWDEAISTYGLSIHLGFALPAVMVQGLFVLSDMPLGSPEARAQSGRLGEALRRLA
jgi:hypothetical protein